MARGLEHGQQIWPKIVNGFLSVYQSANFRYGRGNPWLILISHNRVPVARVAI